MPSTIQRCACNFCRKHIKIINIDRLEEHFTSSGVLCPGSKKLFYDQDQTPLTEDPWDMDDEATPDQMSIDEIRGWEDPLGEYHDPWEGEPLPKKRVFP